MAEEIHEYRAAVGDTAELVCWEFNEFGWSSGNASAWPGSGARGEDHLGSFATTVAHSRKSLSLLANGADGLCHWCVGDMFYRSGLKQGVMYCGLWRYRWEGWVPRPVYYYYAALVEAFRPGCTLLPVEGLPTGVVGLAARQASATHVVLLNHGTAATTVRWAGEGGLCRLRVAPDRLPRRPDIMAHESGSEDLPLADWAVVQLTPEGVDCVLEANELSVFKLEREQA